MDDALVARWKQGEPAAGTAVRNALRTTAERVLSNPALRGAEGHGGRALVEDEERRREITAKVAREVMARGGDSAATLTALALMTAARHAVEAMRVGRPLAGSAHLPPPAVVTMALTPEAIAASSREAYERHLGSCSVCAEDSRLVREVVRSAATATPDTSPVQIDEAVHEHASDAMAEAAAAAVEEIDRQTGSFELRKPAPAAGAKAPAARPFRPAARPVEKPSSGGLRALLPLIVLGGAALWWWSSRRQEKLEGTVDPGIAALADRTPPSVGANEAVPEYAQAGVTALQVGDCRSAAARFRTARRAHAEDRRLWVLEGGSFVCAGDGAAARQTLDVLAADPEATPAALWFHAQALLLTGNVGLALEALEKVADSRSPYAEQARSQRERLKSTSQ